MSSSEQSSTRYAEDWEAFIARLQRLTPKQQRRLQREGEISGRLSMIVALSADWCATYTAVDARRRVRAAQARIAEERRLMRAPGARRQYVDRDTKAMMPSPRLHPVPRAERTMNARHARQFFARSGDHRVAALRREQASSHLMWRALFGTGPAPTREELTQLQETFKALRGPVRRKRPLPVVPVGMSLDRALEIAGAVLKQR